MMKKFDLMLVTLFALFNLSCAQNPLKPPAVDVGINDATTIDNVDVDDWDTSVFTDGFGLTATEKDKMVLELMQYCRRGIESKRNGKKHYCKGLYTEGFRYFTHMIADKMPEYSSLLLDIDEWDRRCRYYYVCICHRLTSFTLPLRLCAPHNYPILRKCMLPATDVTLLLPHQYNQSYYSLLTFTDFVVRHLLLR